MEQYFSDIIAHCDKMQILIQEVGSWGQGIMSNTSTYLLAVAGWWTIVLVASLKKGVITGATNQLEGGSDAC